MKQLSPFITVFAAVAVLMVVLSLVSGLKTSNVEGFHDLPKNMNTDVAQITPGDLKKYGIFKDQAAFDKVAANQMFAGSARFMNTDLGRASAQSLATGDLDITGKISAVNTPIGTIDRIVSKDVGTEKLNAVYAASGELVVQNKICIGDSCMTKDVLSQMIENGGKGMVGPMGPKGADGARGPIGERGPIGPTGPAGPIGPQGPIGPKGNPGEMGPIGKTGPAGPTGPKGDKGDVGPVGPAGPIGPPGARGAPGANGEIGKQGPPGPPGPIGPIGPQGPQGTPGVNANGFGDVTKITSDAGKLNVTMKSGQVIQLPLTGVALVSSVEFNKANNTITVKYMDGNVVNYQIPTIAGSNGSAGSQGPPGPQGPSGPAGPAGVKGDTGAPGPAGPPGPQGPPGPAGSGSGSVALNATPLKVAAAQNDFTLLGTHKVDGPENSRIVISGHTRGYNAGGIENIATNRGNHMWFTQGGAKRTMLQDADGNTIVDGTFAVVNGNKDKWNWINVQRNSEDALFFGGDEVNRGIWSHGARPFSLYTGGANRMQVNPDGRTVHNAGNAGDWNYVMVGPNGRNVHAVHGAGYGMHINTVDENPDKYGLQVFNGKFATHQINNDGRHFLNHSSPDWGFRMHGPNGTNIHAVHGQGHGLHINTANQEPEKWALDIVNGKMGLQHVKNDGRQYLNHSNAKDWGFRMTGPGGKNIHAVHGDGYGLHVNTVDQHPEKYGLEIHNGKHHTLHVKNDGRNFSQHSNANDWGFRMVGPDGRNIHAVHGAGYGMHINTVNQAGDKYGLEVHNGVTPNLRVMNNGSTILGNGPKWHPGEDLNASGTILHKDGQIRSRNTTEGDWIHKFYGKEHINAHLLHNAGYGMHINTRNSDFNKYGLELHNEKGPTFQVRNDGAIINFRKDGRHTWLSHPDGNNYIRGDTRIDGKLCVGDTCITENDLKRFIKHGEEISLRNVKTGNRLQGLNDGTANFNGSNRVDRVRMNIEKCGEFGGVADDKKCA